MEIVVEIFQQSGVCACTTGRLRQEMDEMSERIKEKHGVDVKVYYLPVNARRAREIGIYMANSVVIDGKEALSGMCSVPEIESKILETIEKL